MPVSSWVWAFELPAISWHQACSKGTFYFGTMSLNVVSPLYKALLSYAIFFPFHRCYINRFFVCMCGWWECLGGSSGYQGVLIPKGESSWLFCCFVLITKERNPVQAVLLLSPHLFLFSNHSHSSPMVHHSQWLALGYKRTNNEIAISF